VKKLICISLFCFVALTARCQFIDTLQSVIDRKGSFSFSFNTRDSYISNDYANIFAFNIGVCFAKKFTIGGGLNSLSSAIYNTQIINGQTQYGRLSFFYFSYFVEYTKTFSKHWRLDFSTSIGIGNAYLQYTEGSKAIIENNKTIIPFEPQVELDYNFNKYVGISTQVGYRYMLVNNTLLAYNFNSITYAAGIFISPLDIFAALFPRTKLAKMIEE
jgi:hypothetical protein